MVERVIAKSRRFEEDAQIGFDLVLANVFVETAWAQAVFLVFVVPLGTMLLAFGPTLLAAAVP